MIDTLLSFKHTKLSKSIFKRHIINKRNLALPAGSHEALYRSDWCKVLAEIHEIVLLQKGIELFVLSVSFHGILPNCSGLYFWFFLLETAVSC